jgi:16S rRNA (guanine(966)-N(2))-methyltransferase RsmD
MRVIAGHAKGRRLHAPSGSTTRPTGARLRESVFGILEHRGAVSGARVLDLFAGTGALGLEALSRGADSLVAVEQERSVAKLLERNASLCGFEGRVEVVVQPVDRALARVTSLGPFDLVFLDPPYGAGMIAPVLSGLVTRHALARGALVVVEHGRRDRIDETAGLALELERRYGDSFVTLLRHTSHDDDTNEGSAHAAS